MSLSHSVSSARSLSRALGKCSREFHQHGTGTYARARVPALALLFRRMRSSSERIRDNRRGEKEHEPYLPALIRPPPSTLVPSFLSTILSSRNFFQIFSFSDFYLLSVFNPFPYFDRWGKVGKICFRICFNFPSFCALSKERRKEIREGRKKESWVERIVSTELQFSIFHNLGYWKKEVREIK